MKSDNINDSINIKYSNGNMISLKNPIVLSSMSGITDSRYAIEHAYDAGLIILGSYNIDDQTICAGIKSHKNGRTEFLYEKPIEKIIEEIENFKKLWNEKNKNNKTEMPKIGISIRSKSIEKIIEISNILKQKDIILELDCHCRQKSYLELGLGQKQLEDYENLNSIINPIKKTGVILSIKIRCASIDLNKFINFINETDVDIIHADTMSKNVHFGDPEFIKTMKNNVLNKIIIANNSIKSFEDAKIYLSSGSDMVSIARASNNKETIRNIVTEYKNYINEYGWYNAPNHICKNGDNRGLAFCCPPIKNCSLISKLKELNISHKKYEELKLKYSKNTPLEYRTDTCFGSLIWCCKITKQCYYRDNALNKIGLTKKEYMNYKKELAKNILLEIQ